MKAPLHVMQMAMMQHAEEGRTVLHHHRSPELASSWQWQLLHSSLLESLRMGHIPDLGCL